MIEQEEKEIRNFGLEPLPHDDRDFVFGTVFGDTPLDELPEEFFIQAMVEVKDQGRSDFCTNYASSAASEDQEGVILNPEYGMMKTRSIDGRPLDQWGANLRDAMKVGVNFGFLEQELYPHHDKRADEDRAFLLNPANWDAELDMHAFDHRKNSFFRVDQGSYDVFDNMRSALYANREKNCSIVTGSMWRPGWSKAKNGVIPKAAKTGGSGHAFKIFGWNKIGLVGQLSNGKGEGDSGVFYFPREVVNREFTYGSFMFNDMPKVEAEHLNHNKIKVTDARMVRILKMLRQILIDLINLKTK